MEIMLQVLESRRLMSAGSIDPTFFNGGTGFVQFGQRSVDTVYASKVQPDGKILIVGSTNALDGNGTDLAVARLNPDATLDQSFGETLLGGVGGGLYELTFPTNNDAFYGVALQSDGRIVVVGSLGQTLDDGIPLGDQAVVIRLTADGQLDSTFGRDESGEGNGFVILDLSKNPDTDLPNSSAAAVGIQSDGKIVIGGTAEINPDTLTSSFAIARLEANGAIDTSFGGEGTGIRVLSEPGFVTAISALDVLPDDRVVFTGTALQPSDGVTPVIGIFVTGRTLADGGDDLSFGDEGGVATVFPDSGTADVIAAAAQVKVLPNGQTLVAGYVLRSNGVAGAAAHIGVVRYNVDGSLDTSFGGGTNGGIVETPSLSGAGENNLYIQQLRVRSDGSFFVSGRATRPFSTDITGSVVVRYRADGTLDDTFGNDGIVLLFNDERQTTADVNTQFGGLSGQAGALVEEIPGGGILILASSPTGDLRATRLVADGPDLVTSLTVIKPGSFLGGAKGSAQVKLSNQGTAPFTGTVPVQLFLSVDGALSADDVPITTVSSKVKLLAGQSGKPATVKFNYPAGANVGGQYFVLVSANDARGLAEGNFLNNTSAAGTPVNVNPAFVDLAATLIASPIDAVRAGKKAPFSVQFVNGGNVPANGSITLQLLASPDSVFGDDRLLIGAKPLKINLKPGMKTQKLSGLVPADLGSGEYFLLLNLDATTLGGTNPVRQNVTAMKLTVT